MLLTCIRGEAWPRVPPPPSGAERRLGYPQANFFYFSKQIFFFYFFLPHPITSSIYPFFLSLRGFLFLCVYFPIRVSFRVSEGKKNEYFYPIYSLVCFVVDYSCVFSFVLLSVLYPCIVFCCGCCVFRLFAHPFALCGAFSAFVCNYSS